MSSILTINVLYPYRRYLKAVPEYHEMEDYIAKMLKRKNGALVERRIVEKSLMEAEAIIVWVVKKL